MPIVERNPIFPAPFRHTINTIESCKKCTDVTQAKIKMALDIVSPSHKLKKSFEKRAIIKETGAITIKNFI